MHGDERASEPPNPAPIERIELARTGVTVPVLGAGTYRYRGGVEPLRRAIALGADFIDTAELYETEDVVGAAVRGIRAQVFLATKVLPEHLRPNDLRAAAERSLSALQTDYIDLYQVHHPNPLVPIEETMGAIEDLVDAGKVRFIGVSNFSVAQLREAQAAMSRHPLVSNQVAFSLTDRRATELFAYCMEHDITVIAHSPLAASLPALMQRDRKGALQSIGSARGRTPAQVSLNWCIGSAPLVAIPKSDSTSRVEENAGASGWRLTFAERASLEASIRSIRVRSALETAARGRVRGLLNRVRAWRPGA